MANVTLTVNPDTLDLKVGETANLNITTDEGNTIEVTPVDQSGVVDITETDGTYTITAVKEGTAELTVTAMDTNTDTSSVTVTINVTKEEEQVPTKPDAPTISTERWTNAETKDALLATGDFKEKFKELALHAQTDDRSLIAELSTFNTNTGIIQTTNNNPLFISGSIFNLYKVIMNMLEDAAIDPDPIKFENVLDIIQAYFTEFKNDGFSYNAVTRYLKYWNEHKEDWNIKDGDYETHLVLMKIISTLADPATRDVNKATIDFDTLFADDTLLISDELKDRIVDYYA